MSATYKISGDQPAEDPSSIAWKMKRQIEEADSLSPLAGVKQSEIIKFFWHLYSFQGDRILNGMLRSPSLKDIEDFNFKGWELWVDQKYVDYVKNGGALHSNRKTHFMTTLSRLREYAPTLEQLTDNRYTYGFVDEARKFFAKDFNQRTISVVIDQFTTILMDEMSPELLLEDFSLQCTILGIPPSEYLAYPEVAHEMTQATTMTLFEENTTRMLWFFLFWSCVSINLIFEQLNRTLADPKVTGWNSPFNTYGIVDTGGTIAGELRLDQKFLIGYRGIKLMNTFPDVQKMNYYPKLDYLINTFYTNAGFTSFSSDLRVAENFANIKNTGTSLKGQEAKFGLITDLICDLEHLPPVILDLYQASQFGSESELMFCSLFTNFMPMTEGIFYADQGFRAEYPHYMIYATSIGTPSAESICAMMVRMAKKLATSATTSQVVTSQVASSGVLPPFGSMAISVGPAAPPSPVLLPTVQPAAPVMPAFLLYESPPTSPLPLPLPPPSAIPDPLQDPMIALPVPTKTKPASGGVKTKVTPAKKKKVVYY